MRDATIAKRLVGLAERLAFDEQEATLDDLKGAVSFSPMFISGTNFIVSADGIYKRNPYGSLTFRKIRIRDVYAEIGGANEEEAMEPFKYFTGSYTTLIQKLIATKRYHHKVVT